MQHGFKWTAMSVLVSIASSAVVMACSSSESSGETVELETPAAAGQAATTANQDPCGELGQACCNGPGGTCVDGARCNASGICDTPCGFRGESCCRDATGVGHCYDGSTCFPFPPPARCQ